MSLQFFFKLLVFNCPGNDLGRSGQDVNILIYPFAVMATFIKSHKPVQVALDEQGHVQGGFDISGQQPFSIVGARYILCVLKIDNFDVFEMFVTTINVVI